MKRSTWIILLLFLASVGVFFYIKYRPEPKALIPEATPTKQTTSRKYLFTEESSALTRIRIYDKQHQIVMLERPLGGLWTVSLPTAAPADQSQTEAAATQAASLEILDTLNPSVTAGMVGLEFPTYTMKLTFTTSGEHKLEIGDQTPIGDGYYVRFNNGSIYIIGASGIDTILNFLTYPPYLPTETPLPASTISTATP